MDTLIFSSFGLRNRVFEVVLNTFPSSKGYFRGRLSEERQRGKRGRYQVGKKSPVLGIKVQAFAFLKQRCSFCTCEQCDQ